MMVIPWKIPPICRHSFLYIPYFVGNCRIYIIPYDTFQDPMKLPCFCFLNHVLVGFGGLKPLIHLVHDFQQNSSCEAVHLLGAKTARRRGKCRLHRVLAGKGSEVRHTVVKNGENAVISEKNFKKSLKRIGVHNEIVI